MTVTGDSQDQANRDRVDTLDVGRGGDRPAGVPVLPEHSVDDTDAGWGERSSSNDDRLLAERPPHWG